jgi:hypothetical protein
MNKSVVVAAAAGALAAIALSMAQDAHADESSYINSVASYGVEPSQAVLTLGHQICGDISYYGVAGIQADVNNAVAAGVSAHTTSVIIVVAVSELCPSNEPALNAWLYPTTKA